MLKSCLIALCLLLPVQSFAQQQSAPPIQFESVPDFFKLPDDLHFGEIGSVAVNSQRHVFVFTRTNPRGGIFGPGSGALLEFGAEGKYIREIGKGLYAWAVAHGVRVDKDDNIWAVDRGSDMVIRFNPAGRVVWVFGRKPQALEGGTGPYGDVDPPLPAQVGRFREPTDVAWDSQGNIYITDGYVNSRVAKYDKNGDWVKQWGTRGTGPGQFNNPHAIVIDRNDNLYVGDRGNRRVQVFDTDGKFLRMFAVEVLPDFTSRAVNGATPAAGLDGVGAPNSLCITNGPNNTQVLFLGESTWPGRVFKLTLDGKVLGVIGRSGRNLGQFSGAHGLACPSENEIYVAETSNWRVQKLLLKR